MLLPESMGMRARRLLLPIDLERCPPEVFPLSRRLIDPSAGDIILLNVLDRRPGSIPPAASTALLLLAGLGRDHLDDGFAWRSSVREGVPHEEILAEAVVSEVDLILLPIPCQSLWRRMLGSGYGRTTLGLVSGAPCRVFVVDVRKRVNCLRQRLLWAPAASGIC